MEKGLFKRAMLVDQVMNHQADPVSQSTTLDDFIDDDSFFIVLLTEIMTKKPW